MSISVAPKFKKELDRAAKELGVSRSQYVQQVLQRELVAREFQRVRSKLRPYAERLGVFTDEDVVRRLES